MLMKKKFEKTNEEINDEPDSVNWTGKWKVYTECWKKFSSQLNDETTYVS